VSDKNILNKPRVWSCKKVNK